jgi:hypothetical protein
MANYAYTENGEVLEVYDYLPVNWKTYSNFFALESDTDFLNSIGWYKVESIVTDYNSKTQKLGKSIYTLNTEENRVYETKEVIDLKQSELEQISEERLAQLQAERVEREWTVVREKRDRLMKENDWRYLRYERQIRMEETPTESLEIIDAYMKALADITTQEDPFNLVWPEINSSEVSEESEESEE